MEVCPLFYSLFVYVSRITLLKFGSRRVFETSFHCMYTICTIYYLFQILTSCAQSVLIDGFPSFETVFRINRSQGAKRNRIHKEVHTEAKENQRTTGLPGHYPFHQL